MIASDELEEAKREILRLVGEREEAYTALAVARDEAERQFRHDHAHLMAEAAAHGETKRQLERARRWAARWKASARKLRRLLIRFHFNVFSDD